MRELLGARRLEGVDLAAKRIDAADDVLDDAVFAGRIHALEHDQHRPLAVGVKPLLKFTEAAHAFGKNRSHVLDVSREAKSFGGVVVGKLELRRFVDPTVLDDLAELHLAAELPLKI